MALVDGSRYCTRCAKSLLTAEVFKNAVFVKSDAKLRCPSKSCEAKDLSFRDFYLGSCCKAASVWKNDKRMCEI